ncbi:MAG: hypothetical protein AB9819_04065 [Methanomassiliicoccales archaeon]
MKNPELLTISGEKTVYYVVKGRSGTSPIKYFSNYDEADQFVEEMTTLSGFDEQEKYLLCTRVDEDHYLLIETLINKYLESEEIMDQPVIVFYKRSKVYKIVSKEILTNEHWVKDPFTLFGSIFDTNVLVRDP